jgi:hypothetical protein
MRAQHEAELAAQVAQEIVGHCVELEIKSARLMASSLDCIEQSRRLLGNTQWRLNAVAGPGAMAFTEGLQDFRGDARPHLLVRK